MGAYQQVRAESFDDKHIMAKHNSIYPSKEEVCFLINWDLTCTSYLKLLFLQIAAIQEVVSNSEKALKLVSDQIAEE